MDREKVIEGLEQFRTDFKPFCGNGADWERFDAGLSLLKEQPEIIRCKDCKHGEKPPTFQYYPKVTWCNKHSKSHNDDWFCADGERKTNCSDNPNS